MSATHHSTPSTVFRFDGVKVRVGPAAVLIDTCLHGDLPVKMGLDLGLDPRRSKALGGEALGREIHHDERVDMLPNTSGESQRQMKVERRRML